MKRNLTIITTAILCTVVAASIQAEPLSERREGYMLRAKARGIFGLPRNRTVDAIFYVSPTKLRIDLATGESSSIVDLDCKHLIEVNYTERKYVLRTFEKLPFRWKSRRQDLEIMAERIKAGLASGKLTKKAAREQASGCGLHVRPDGTFEVKQVPRIIKTGESKTIAGYKAHEVIVKENDIEVFRLWLTKDVSRPFDVVKFYTAIGYLSPEMEKKLGDLEGFPVEIHMVLHVKKKKMEIDMELSEFLPAKVHDLLFTVPASYELKKKSFPGIMGKCSYCGKPLGGGRIKLTLDGSRYEFCGRKHENELQLEFDAADQGVYISLLKDLLQKGNFQKIEKRLDNTLRRMKPPRDREKIKKWLKEQKESE